MSDGFLKRKKNRNIGKILKRTEKREKHDKKHSEFKSLRKKIEKDIFNKI